MSMSKGTGHMFEPIDNATDSTIPTMVRTPILEKPSSAGDEEVGLMHFSGGCPILRCWKMRF